MGHRPESLAPSVAPPGAAAASACASWRSAGRRPVAVPPSPS